MHFIEVIFYRAVPVLCLIALSNFTLHALKSFKLIQFFICLFGILKLEACFWLRIKLINK